MPPLPLVPLAVAGAVGGFLAGRVFGQPEAGAGGPAIAGGVGAPAADSSLAGSTSDVWDSWGTASLNFAGSEGVGELAGVLPIPPSPFVQPPPPAPAPAPAPATAPLCWPSGPPRPAGATRWVKVLSTHFRLYTLSGGTAIPGAYYSANFSAWIGPNVTLKTTIGGTATFAKILSGGHAGRYLHTSAAGVTIHVCPAGTR